MAEQVTADRRAYTKLLNAPLWRLRVVPQFDHGHSHRLVKDDVDTVHLETIIPKSQTGNPSCDQLEYMYSTSPGSTGANHMCLPSWVLLSPSINLSGVLTSPLTVSSAFTLSGKAAMSEGHDAEERFVPTNTTQLQSLGQLCV